MAYRDFLETPSEASNATLNFKANGRPKRLKGSIYLARIY